jgi:hypothetical protein
MMFGRSTQLQCNGTRSKQLEISLLIVLTVPSTTISNPIESLFSEEEAPTRLDTTQSIFLTGKLKSG